MVKKNIRVCCGMTCSPSGGPKTMRTIENSVGLKAGEKNNDIDLGFCGCTGHCHMAPVVVVNGNFIHQAKPENIMNEIEKAANQPPQDSNLIEATVEEAFSNDFLGDLS